VTGLLSLSAVDLQVALRGNSLAQLYPLLGVALPRTNAYAASGHLLRKESSWRYEKFTGRVGKSDVAGSLQLELSNGRPFLRGEVVSKVLNLDDLGPVIGARSAGEKTAAKTLGRVLPDLPFDPAHLRAIDADITLRAASILRAKALPLDQLVTRLKLQNSVLQLNPLEFAAAGGRLVANIQLDARLCCWTRL
jgi:uncharacterized protein involved in outer membrane biogenesis